MRQTSVEAYRKIKDSGVLSTRRWEAYHALFHHGPLTGQELARLTGVPGMWKRCSELEQVGVVYNSCVRPCKVTGQEAIAWDVTANVPTQDYQASKGTEVFYLVKAPGKIGRAFNNEEQAVREYQAAVKINPQIEFIRVRAYPYPEKRRRRD